MSYPTKHHTQAVSSEYLTHVLALFPEEVHTPIALALHEYGIDTLLDLLAEDVERVIAEAYYDDNKYLRPKEKRVLRQIHEWLIWETKNRPDIDFTTLMMSDLDNYLSNKITKGMEDMDVKPDVPVS